MFPSSIFYHLSCRALGLSSRSDAVMIRIVWLEQKEQVRQLPEGFDLTGAHCMQGVANRDIKLENTLLDANPRPLLKICDFGYSKVLPSLPMNN